MRAFDELEDSAKEAIVLSAVSPILRKFLSWRQDDIDDISDEIFNDLTLLVYNKHPKSDRKELSQEVRDRVRARLAKALYKVAFDQVKHSNYSDTAPTNAYKFDLSKWLQALSSANPRTFLEPTANLLPKPE